MKKFRVRITVGRFGTRGAEVAATRYVVAADAITAFRKATDGIDTLDRFDPSEPVDEGE